MRPAPMAGGADRNAAARGSCPAIDSGQRRAAGHRLDPHGRAVRLRWWRRRLGRQPMRSCGERLGLVRGCGLCRAFLRLRRNEINRRPARRRRVGGRRRFGRPEPALSPARRPTPPDPPTQALAAGRRHGRSLQISPPAIRRRECRPLSSINHPHQDTPNLGLPAACPLFRGAKTPATVPMFDYCVGDLHACQWLWWGCVVGAEGDS